MNFVWIEGRESIKNSCKNYSNHTNGINNRKTIIIKFTTLEILVFEEDEYIIESDANANPNK